ncbi:MAG: AMP-binding protein [Alphaproteobacteria bacterium]
MQTIWDLLAKADPARALLRDGGQNFSVAQVRTQAAAIGAWLSQNGVGAGDRVAVHLPRSADEAMLTFAIAYAGGVVVNLNYQWTADQLSYAVQDCDARILFTTQQKARALTKAGHERLFEHLLIKEEAWPEATGDPVPRAANDLAALLYTSGSTGSPKGVMVSHQNLLDGARIVSAYLGLTAGDKILGLLPPSFDYGLNQILSAAYVGAEWVAHAVPMPAEIAKAVKSEGVTVLPLVAPSWMALSHYLGAAEETLPGLRLVTNTGGKISDGVLATLPTQLPNAEIVLMYGLTEAFRSTYLPPHLYDTKRGSIGHAIPDVEIFVVHEDKGLCEPGEVGELVHRGALISQGYWGKPDQSARIIRSNPHLNHLIGDEPVCHSGDLVRADEDGILWYVGRADGMIKSSGFRMSPTEIEDILLRCPGVKEAVVWGESDEELGQKVIAALSGDAAEADLRKFCRANMPSYMVPGHFWLSPAVFPRTGNGKIDREQVRAAAQSSDN